MGEDDRGLGTSELSVLSLLDSEEPESEDPGSDMSDKEPSSGAYDDFNMDSEDEADQDNHSEDVGQEQMDVEEHWEDADGGDCQHIEDVSGLFS